MLTAPGPVYARAASLNVLTETLRCRFGLDSAMRVERFTLAEPAENPIPTVGFAPTPTRTISSGGGRGTVSDWSSDVMTFQLIPPNVRTRPPTSTCPTTRGSPPCRRRRWSPMVSLSDDSDESQAAGAVPRCSEPRREAGRRNARTWSAAHSGARRRARLAPRVNATSVLDRCFPVHDYSNPRRRRVIIGARDDDEALAVGRHVKRKIGTVDAVFDLEQRLD